jgi:hypothetical protein
MAVAGVAVVVGLLIGLTVDAWLGWQMALVVAALTGWRLRFRPSAGARIWQRQAAMQRRTAAALGPLADQGWLVLHDLTSPGWPGSLEHLVVGPTGVWLVDAWDRRRLLPGGSAPPGIVHGLRGQAEALAEVLDGWAQVPVRPLLCVHSRWSVPPSSADGLPVAAPRQLPDIFRRGPKTPSEELERATSRLLEVLRPAA